MISYYRLVKEFNLNFQLSKSKINLKPINQLLYQYN
jgi:hypothetical protein